MTIHDVSGCDASEDGQTAVVASNRQHHGLLEEAVDGVSLLSPLLQLLQLLLRRVLQPQQRLDGVWLLVDEGAAGTEGTEALFTEGGAPAEEDSDGRQLRRHRLTFPS